MAEDHAGPANTKPAAVKPHPRRRREPPIPRDLRKEAVQHARAMAKKYFATFAADPKLKYRVLRLVCAILPPKPRRRGRPRNQIVTRAIALLRRFRRDFPERTPQENWDQVCLDLIPNYDRLPDLEQRTEREYLQERVKWRLRKRCRKIIPAKISVS